MEAPYRSSQTATFRAAMRAFSFARGLLALFGLMAIMAVAAELWDARLPQDLVPRVVDLQGSSRVLDADDGSTQVSSGESVHDREQRAVAEFISKRFRVAEESIASFVSSAYRAGAQYRVDPLLILAVVAVESRFNPVAESVLGAKGLMQILPKYHQDKLLEHGGETALLDPEINIQVGTRILRDYLRRVGEIEAALQMYAGAIDEPASQYSGKVLAERARLEQRIARVRAAAV